MWELAKRRSELTTCTRALENILFTCRGARNAEFGGPFSQPRAASRFWNDRDSPAPVISDCRDFYSSLNRLAVVHGTITGLVHSHLTLGLRNYPRGYFRDEIQSLDSISLQIQINRKSFPSSNMASTSDIRDIMNLGQAGPRQPAPKRKKPSDAQPRVTGVRREVQALMGDSVPPIAIIEQRSYKTRPSASQAGFRPRHWDERPFTHGARTDGLILKHWKKSIAVVNSHAAVANGSTDVQMTEDGKTTAPAVQEMRFEDDLPSHKWNVKVQIPSYTDDQYENLLKAEDWTREETDYLMDLCRDFDLRWILIADRYVSDEIPASTPPPTNGEATGPEVVAKTHYPPRTMESLKQRYYTIAAKMMEIATPASTMTATEFQLWERMRTFDAKTETMRKAMAEKLFERTKDEADEERILLEELHRITKDEDEFVKMRAELYARLEPVAPLRRSGNGEEQSTALYQTSGGLSMLLQSLLAKEKRLKRPAVPEGASAGASATPTDARHEKSRQSSQYGRRDTLDTQATNDEPHKKASVSQAPAVRVLAPADAAKFGVSHPLEKLTSGVQFRHEKINRLTMAKSQTQTTKIQAALTELGIPARLLMPTERVCREFERLVGEINTLLDCRKVNEKVAAEIRILEEQKRIRLGLPKGAKGKQNVDGSRDVQGLANTSDAMEIDDSQVGDTSNLDASTAVAREDDDAEAEDDEPTQASIQEDGAENDESVIKKDAQGDDDEEGDDQVATKSAEDEDEEDERNEEEVTGVDNDEDEDEDEDPEVDAEEQTQFGMDDDDDDDEEDEARARQLQQDSDVEDEDEQEGNSDEEAEPEMESEDEDESRLEAEEDDSDAEAQAAAQKAAAAEESSADEQDSDEQDEDDEEEDAAPSAPLANEDESDEDVDEAEAVNQAQDDADEDEEDQEPPAPVPAVRAHKRSASVISESSRAGSNRSGVGRKKRR